jgi:DoxX-like family
METTNAQSKATLWTGRIITILCVLFLLMDAVMKVAKATVSVEASGQLGWPANLVPAIGWVLLASTILYAIPRTAFLGAILLTGYLGGAIAIMLRAGQPYYFPIIFGVLVWTGLALRDSRVRSNFIG